MVGHTEHDLMSCINRKPHALKREKTLAIPRHFIFFDTETKPIKQLDGSVVQRFELGWACYWRRGYGRNREKIRWYNFTDAGDFWAFVACHIQPKIKIWVLARNIVFDFTVLEGWKHLRSGGYKLKFFHNAGCTTIISVKAKGGSIVFLDVMNWFVESLAKTGERIGIPKLKIDFETTSTEYLNTYCKRDVEIELENFKRFIRFLEGNSVSRLCYTRGSTAMAAYLFRHYDRRIYIHNNKEALDLERDSYRGGRTECFFLGNLSDDNYHILDVNSLYPFVMREQEYPVKYKRLVHDPKISDLVGFLQSYSVISSVMIVTDEPVYAVRRKRTIFPVGRFWVTLTSPELKYALKHGHIKKVGFTVLYDKANIFRSYVDRFYQLRREFADAGIAEYEELCKKMLNSLYGKFGQKADVWKKIGNCPNEPDRVEILYISGSTRRSQIRYLLGEVFELVGYEESFNSFPAIASHVTAYARLHLYDLMKIAGAGNYFYCDTDSLAVNDTGLDRLAEHLDSTQLGRLKIVESTRSLFIRGLKDYVIDEREVVKGVRKNAVKIRDGLYQQEQWPSFRGLLRNGQPDTYTVKTITKSLTREYTKGTVTDNGLIDPLILADDVRPPPLLF